MKVPLLLPRSSTWIVAPTMEIMAWRRDTVGSSSRRSQPGLVPTAVRSPSGTPWHSSLPETTTSLAGTPAASPEVEMVRSRV
jgi:hypothetical protein